MRNASARPHSREIKLSSWAHLEHERQLQENANCSSLTREGNSCSTKTDTTAFVSFIRPTFKRFAPTPKAFRSINALRLKTPGPGWCRPCLAGADHSRLRIAGRIAPLPYSSTLSSFPAIAPRLTPCHAPPTGLASTPAALPRRSRCLNGQPAAVNLGVRRGTAYSQLLEIAAWPPLQVVHERWHCFIARALLFFARPPILLRLSSLHSPSSSLFLSCVTVPAYRRSFLHVSLAFWASDPSRLAPVPTIRFRWLWDRRLPGATDALPRPSS